ncbi:glycosyltransferase [bacterium]|nr:glycosyltransferase [bacterium]
MGSRLFLWRVAAPTRSATAMPERDGERMAVSPIDPRPAATAPLSGRHGAVVVYSYFPEDPRPLREARALVQAGMTLDYVCLTQDPALPRREHVDGIDVIRIPLRRRRRGKLTYLWQYLAFLLGAGAVISRRALRRPYDLVHVHNMPDVLVFTALVARWRGARVLLDLHDPMPELMETIFGLDPDSRFVRFLRWSERLSLRFADHAITANEAFRRLFVARSCPERKMSVVVNTPEESVFVPDPGAVELARPPDRFELMYHGSLVERHGLLTALEAVARLVPTMPELRFSIYGHPTPFVETIETRIAELGLGGVVSYRGARDLSGIAAAVAACDLGLVPNERTSFTEINLPTRLFEYLALGKPVIAPDTRGIRDYFGDEDMVYFQPGKAEDLARTIVWVREHPDEVAGRVASGQRVYQAHRWTDERRILLGVVDDLLSSRSGHER